LTLFPVPVEDETDVQMKYEQVTIVAYQRDTSPYRILDNYDVKELIW
jgi:hypothetical protein